MPGKKGRGKAKGHEKQAERGHVPPGQAKQEEDRAPGKPDYPLRRVRDKATEMPDAPTKLRRALDTSDWRESYLRMCDEFEAAYKAMQLWRMIAIFFGIIAIGIALMFAV